MSFLYKPWVLALLLFVMLVFSFLWCTISNIFNSTQVVQTGDIGPVSMAVVLEGSFWLVGHGIHGAAIVALPAILMRRVYPRHDIFNWEQELDVWSQNYT